MRESTQVFLLSCAGLVALVLFLSLLLLGPKENAESGEKLRANTPAYVQVDSAPTSPFLTLSSRASLVMSSTVCDTVEHYRHTCARCNSDSKQTLTYSLLIMAPFPESGCDPTYHLTEAISATDTRRAPAFAVLASSRLGLFRTLDARRTLANRYS